MLVTPLARLFISSVLSLDERLNHMIYVIFITIWYVTIVFLYSFHVSLHMFSFQYFTIVFQLYFKYSFQMFISLYFLYKMEDLITTFLLIYNSLWPR